ncbi:MAG TPA: 6-carboxytetrahydropterin synthase [Spirochaetia bacterium]|nr:6-carboxytetrahydropterin synthase [Spirochaetia bacterium]
MFRTGVLRSFNARHALRGEFGTETLPHTHPYQVEWICESPVLDRNGFSVDISRMEKTMESVLQAIDGRLLNDLDYFRNRQPSLENLAVYLHLELERAFSLSGAFRDQIGTTEVRIWESATAWASYSSRTVDQTTEVTESEDPPT